MDLPRGAIGTPMTYMLDDKQYIALTIGGTPPELIAFALPTQESVATASAQLHSIWQGVYTDVQATRGARVFVRECVQCHSDNAGATSGEGTATSLVGEDFRFRWTDSSIADLFDSISQTMPLSAPNSLSLREYSAVTAYLLRLNEYPAGTAELDHNARENLRGIFIDQGPPQD